MGERSDAVLWTAMPSHDEYKNNRAHIADEKIQQENLLMQLPAH